MNIYADLFICIYTYIHIHLCIHNISFIYIYIYIRSLQGSRLSPKEALIGKSMSREATCDYVQRLAKGTTTSGFLSISCQDFLSKTVCQTSGIEPGDPKLPFPCGSKRLSTTSRLQPDRGFNLRHHSLDHLEMTSRLIG